ncbi:PTS system mannose/fructose/N-acetylgalactosamine-transporter subunit IIB [Oenococcus kitaharae]|uniref:PTS systemmannose-specific IIB component n=1 Tax=Oenococcus kitaharae DSM 17330 TaxID=1045004 RepID=G9WET1_9LACO|nr:PTS sugar transporter subunit IIB [Oenococcus kitaharae]EHN58254.1 PTS systemmannose-specific IIB component [Oenococcus kitaharae DSM 17330]MCV3296504.1 PTS sugar transporter subunit IIB [Oenococcus kitaharae]OEY81681.1 PTS mannose transporter subunit IIAB [Oenococcus kitaharae]OEY83168.1 PTS mannose transporter subunit IIAB [Oenococcus kitaharae]OEY84663.1 PTS mannose transporter subunit IIAB [Oenococcus kitaharae]
MAIAAVRIDGRLLHGQVANMWTSVIKPTRIMVIDNATADSEIEKAAIKLARPAGVNLSILNEEKAIDHILKGRYDSQRVFILARKPQVIVNLLAAGVAITDVNVGNMSESEGTRPLTKSINVLQEDVDAFMALHDKGVNLTVQMVPSDPLLDLMQLLHKFSQVR